jgi:hypothetical protein
MTEEGKQAVAKARALHDAFVREAVALDPPDRRTLQSRSDLLCNVSISANDALGIWGTVPMKRRKIKGFAGPVPTASFRGTSAAVTCPGAWRRIGYRTRRTPCSAFRRRKYRRKSPTALRKATAPRAGDSRACRAPPCAYTCCRT